MRVESFKFSRRRRRRPLLYINVKFRPRASSQWKMVDRPLMTRICARCWLPRFSALLAWRGGERRMQRKQCVKFVEEAVRESPPPPFSTSRCDVGVTSHGPGGKAEVEEAVREIFTPPPFSTSGCGVGGGHLPRACCYPPSGRFNQSLEGGSRSRAAGGHDLRAAWRHGQDLRATCRYDLWLRVQGYMFNQTLGDR